MSFRNHLAESVFNLKYRHKGCETWEKLCRVLVEEVCLEMSKDDRETLIQFMIDKKFLPAGRYLYYAGRKLKYYNNCLLIKALEDTREDWANLSYRVQSALMTGAGIGVDYSVYRPEGSPLKRTGGAASGPIKCMQIINEIGRYVQQGGSRRSALWAGLNWAHKDAKKLLKVKDWNSQLIPGTQITFGDAKQIDYTLEAPLDCTNISLLYDTEWLEHYNKTGEVGETFLENCKYAMMNGEPGFAMNFYDKEKETLRNAPVSKDTYVLLKEGYAKIEEVVDKPVTIWTGKQWASDVVFKKTKENVETLKIGFTGQREIKADPEHEFFVERYKGKGSSKVLEKIEKVAASDLKVGDILHASYPNDGHHLEMEHMHRDFYTLGFIYGDGSFTKYGAEFSICHESKEACLERMCKDDLIQYNCSRGYKRFAIKKEMFKGLSKDYIREDIHKEMYKDRGKMKIFLSGLFDADGCIMMNGKTPSVRLGSSNLGFLKEIRRMMDFLGIQSGICKGAKSGFSGNESYSLSIYSSSIRTFLSSMFSVRMRMEIGDYKPYRDTQIKVTSISQGEIEDVYCCDVKVEEHSFMAEGIIISNCTEVTSEDDSDICNLGSINLAEINDLEEFKQVTELATKFLTLGTLRAQLPYDKVYQVREKNRRLGLGLMGMHEWLLVRNYKYEVVPELHTWLKEWKDISDTVSEKFCDKLSISRSIAKRSIAPTGSIGILAGTSTGLEPIYSVAYKRRYLHNETWHYEYVIDNTAKILIEQKGVHPDSIESSIDLAMDYERRIKFQYDVQKYVDQAISSTLNLPRWGSKFNNEDKVEEFAKTLAKYAHGLRGFTCYPDGARGGQPIVPCSYEEAESKEGQVHIEAHDACKGGVCGA